MKKITHDELRADRRALNPPATRPHSNQHATNPTASKRRAEGERRPAEAHTLGTTRRVRRTK